VSLCHRHLAQMTETPDRDVFKEVQYSYACFSCYSCSLSELAQAVVRAFARKLASHSRYYPPCPFPSHRTSPTPSKSPQQWIQFLTLPRVLCHVSIDLNPSSERVTRYTRSRPRVVALISPNSLRRLVVVLRLTNMGTTLHAMRCVCRKHGR
jgi:hypothetical protein